MDIVALTLFFALVTAFVIRAWKAHGRLSGRDRWALITSFAVAATTFVIAALRWPELAWFSGTRPTWRAIRIGATLVSCALIVGVAVL